MSFHASKHLYIYIWYRGKTEFISMIANVLSEKHLTIVKIPEHVSGFTNEIIISSEPGQVVDIRHYNTGELDEVIFSVWYYNCQEDYAVKLLESMMAKNITASINVFISDSGIGRAKCSNCNTSVFQSDKFCRKCGREFIETTYTYLTEDDAP